VKPVIVSILFVLLGQAASVPAAALVHASSAQGLPHTDSMKQYLKHLKKEQKKARSSQRRAAKKWNKSHNRDH
jgi:hypothetical protein